MIHNTIRLTFHPKSPVSCSIDGGGSAETLMRDRDPGRWSRQIKAEPALSKPHRLMGLVSGKNLQNIQPHPGTEEGGQRTVTSPPPTKPQVCIHVRYPKHFPKGIWIQTLKFIHDCKWFETCIWLNENTCKVQDFWMFQPQGYFLLRLLLTHKISSALW